MVSSMSNAAQKSVRLETDTIETLSGLFREHLQEYPDAVVYLFGSRADSQEKGGDLDLLVVSRRAASYAYEIVKTLRMAIEEELGSQKVDILISPDPYREDQPAFIHLAFMDGVQLWP